MVVGHLGRGGFGAVEVVPALDEVHEAREDDDGDHHEVAQHPQRAVAAEETHSHHRASHHRVCVSCSHF